MGESTRPSLRQLRDLYNFIGECCELGADPIAWRRHVAEQLPALFGAQVALYSEYVVAAAPFRELHWLKPRILLDFGCRRSATASLRRTLAGRSTRIGAPRHSRPASSQTENLSLVGPIWGGRFGGSPSTSTNSSRRRIWTTGSSRTT